MPSYTIYLSLFFSCFCLCSHWKKGGTTDEKRGFILNISRDPKERQKEEKDAKEKNDRKESDEEAEEKEVTAYARVGESQIVYQLSTEEYESLMDMTYDSLRHCCLRGQRQEIRKRGKKSSGCTVPC